MAEKIPASIRHNNPSAMWPGLSATKFGAEGSTTLKDGQRNKIATFTNPVNGAAAQFDLLQRAYVGMTVDAALGKWGGNNYKDEYVAIVAKRTGLAPTDRLTAAYLRDPKTGVKFAKAMAFHEAGYEYPLTNKQWKQAHAMVFEPKPTAWWPWSRIEIPAADVPADEDLGLRMVGRARTFLGTKEISGKQHNQTIVDLFKIVGRDDVRDDETPWCAAFVGAIAVLEGAAIPPPEDALLARKYLTAGKEIPKDPEAIKPGDWFIKARGPAPFGHIGLVSSVDRSKRTVRTIDGNADNQVAYKTYSIDEALGFTRPVMSSALPNGKKTVIQTIRDSNTLRSLFNGFAAIVVGSVVTLKDAVTDVVGTAVGILPEAVTNTEQTVSLMQRTAAIFNVTWPLWLGVTAASAAILYAFTRGLGERRPAQ